MSTDRAAQIAALSLPLDQLPDPLPIPTIEKPFDVTIRPPGSKSITNRALLLAALADGTSELRGPLIDADDAQVMLRAIQQLGAKVEIIRADSTPSASEGSANLDIVRITGVAGRWKIPAGQTVTLNLNNAGTATRFLTAAAILAPADSGGIIIDGDARMRERPIGELVDALHQLGITVRYLGNSGLPPVHVSPITENAPTARTITFGVTSSSQFISAMLLVGSFLSRRITAHIPDKPTSAPYIHMTLGVLQSVGVDLDTGMHVSPSERDGPDTWSIQTVPKRLAAFQFVVEPDASGATYFIAATLLIPSGRLYIPDAAEDTLLQGDSQFFEVCYAVGGGIDEVNGGVIFYAPGFVKRHPVHSLRPFTFDFGPMPDTAMTAAVLACFASPTSENPTATSTLRGLRTLRVKETDRLAALQTELTKLGALVEIIPEAREGQADESLRITPPSLSTLGTQHSPLTFDTYHDHRMAMSLALIGLRRPNVFIRNPKCVAKTYPTFWKDLAKLYQ